MSDRYEYHSHCMFNLGYHVIFCPKYRRKVLRWGIDERLKILLVEKATAIGCRIEKYHSGFLNHSPFSTSRSRCQ